MGTLLATLHHWATSNRVVTVAVHSKKDVGKGLAHQILKDAGLI